MTPREHLERRVKDSIQEKIAYQKSLIDFFSRLDKKRDRLNCPHEKEIWEIKVRIAILGDLHREIFGVPMEKV